MTREEGIKLAIDRLKAEAAARGGVVMTFEEARADAEARRKARIAHEAAQAARPQMTREEIHAAQAKRLGLTVEQVKAMHPADLDDRLAGRQIGGVRWTGD